MCCFLCSPEPGLGEFSLESSSQLPAGSELPPSAAPLRPTKLSSGRNITNRLRYDDTTTTTTTTTLRVPSLLLLLVASRVVYVCCNDGCNCDDVMVMSCSLLVNRGSKLLKPEGCPNCQKVRACPCVHAYVCACARVCVCVWLCMWHVWAN